MTRFGTTVGLALVLALTGTARPADAQVVETPEPPDRLAIFLDCGICDDDDRAFVRQEVTYVDHVRDREVADVHVLVTTEATGAGGAAVTLDLIGRRAFLGMDFSTVFNTRADATDDDEREAFLRVLEASLVPYLLGTATGERVRVEVDEPGEDGTGQTTLGDDPWDHWTFVIYADGNADFESRRREFDTRYGVYIDRVTAAWKIQLRPFFNYDYVRIERDGEEGEEDRVITSTARRDGVTSYVVKSVSQHWSVGAFADVFTSTFDNVDVRYRFMPAVEYNLYPYREATRRQLTLAYRAGVSHVAYRDTTIYGETEQLLPEHTLTVGWEMTQPWGEIDLGMHASQYLDDLERYAVQFGGGVDFRITQGLSIEIGGEFAFIRNQLNLPKGDADLEEVLLRRRALETDYEAGLRFGLRYRFGSLYNNVVNTRFGGGPNQDRF